MKDLIVNKTINFITRYNYYNDIKIEELKYGLIGIYLLITKFIFILILSIFLGIYKQMLLFTLFYIPIRAVSFGLHAAKSWMCWIASTIMFIIIPFVCSLIKIDVLIKSIVGIITLLIIFKYSPADTHKRPIVNKNKRLLFKYLSVFITIIYCFGSICSYSNFISNCLLFVLVMQSFMIHPLIYKIFKLPYNNYKNYTLN